MGRLTDSVLAGHSAPLLPQLQNRLKFVRETILVSAKLAQDMTPGYETGGHPPTMYVAQQVAED